MSNKRVATNWDSKETWERLVSAIIASGLDLREIAKFYGTTYDTLENRLRKVKKDAAVLKEEVSTGERAEIQTCRTTPTTPKKPRTPKTPKAVGSLDADDPTTSSAITQHIAKLARKVGGTAGASAATPRLIAPTKTTPSKKFTSNSLMPIAPSSKTGSSKKRPMRSMHDDDGDDDADDEENFLRADEESPTKRQQVNRRSKTPGKSYRFAGSDEENGGNGVAKIKLEKGSEGPELGFYGMANGGHDEFGGHIDESVFNMLN
nr:hypothetical protein CFP56_33496 [Quercus suber]